jgi:hypothetical protein
MSASKYFEQESLPARDFFAKRKMIFILWKCRRAKIPNLKSELCFASQKVITTACGLIPAQHSLKADSSPSIPCVAFLF